MSLDITLTAVRPTQVYYANITHNLAPMAEAAGIYEHLWRPEELGITTADALVEPLSRGLELLLSDEAKFRRFNAPNGWGKYEHLVRFVRAYIDACRDNPDATIHADR